MPVGAYGGRRDIMEMVSPSGPVYQAGTLSGNPVAMAAGLSQLGFLRDHPEVYAQLAQTADSLFDGLAGLARRNGAPCVVNKIGSIGSLFWTAGKVFDLDSALKADTARYADYFNFMLDNGVYQAPAQFEAMFLSAAHTHVEVDKTLEAAERFFHSRPQASR
jgi:glutamate-1-semialdehyde 2,1-aminomutase